MLITIAFIFLSLCVSVLAPEGLRQARRFLYANAVALISIRWVGWGGGGWGWGRGVVGGAVLQGEEPVLLD